MVQEKYQKLVLFKLSKLCFILFEIKSFFII
jgi:hypothetical protein